MTRTPRTRIYWDMGYFDGARNAPRIAYVRRELTRSEEREYWEGYAYARGQEGKGKEWAAYEKGRNDRKEDR